MPRRAAPARLVLRQRAGREPVYVILDTDGGRRVERATGTGDRRAAEDALARYLTDRAPDHPPGRQAPSAVYIADVLSWYALGRGPVMRPSSAKSLAYAIDTLLPFWADKTVADVTPASTAAYARHRAGRAPSTIRLELANLTAALNWADNAGIVDAPFVEKPPPSAPRDRWLTEGEAARLLRAARQTPHLADFILMGLRTGTRSSAILALQWERNPSGGRVDLAQGMLYRSAVGETKGTKRKPPIPIAKRLLPRLRMARARTRTHVIEYDGAPIASIKKSFAAAAHRAALPDISPHTLRHTAITWAMQRGQSPHDVAAYFGVSIQTMFSVYVHHHPDHLRQIADAMG